MLVPSYHHATRARNPSAVPRRQKGGKGGKGGGGAEKEGLEDMQQGKKTDSKAARRAARRQEQDALQGGKKGCTQGYTTDLMLGRRHAHAHSTRLWKVRQAAEVAPLKHRT